MCVCVCVCVCVCACHQRVYALRKLERMRQNYQQLPAAHQLLLPGYLTHVERCRAAIDTNDDFVRCILGGAENVFENSDVANFVSTTPLISTFYILCPFPPEWAGSRGHVV